MTERVCSCAAQTELHPIGQTPCLYVEPGRACSSCGGTGVVGMLACVYCSPAAQQSGRVETAMRSALDGFGGYLRCETCRRTEPLGSPGLRVTTTGWPKCCGYTMRWWTQRQIDAGEVTP